MKVEMRVTIDIDLAKQEIEDSDLRSHVHDQILVTGHLHPGDPLFDSIKGVRISNFRIRATPAETAARRRRARERERRKTVL